MLIKIHKEKMKKTFGLMLVAFILMEPGYLSTIAMVDKVFEVLKVIVTLYIIFKFVFEKEKMSYYILIIFLYEGIVFFSTIVNLGNYRQAILEMAYVVDWCLLTQLMVRKDAYTYISAIYYTLEIYAILNLTSYIVCPDGLYVNGIGFACFFLGYRNTAYQYLFPMLTLSVMYNIMQYGKIKYRVYIDWLCCVLFTVLAGSATGNIIFYLYFAGLLVYEMLSHIKLKWVYVIGMAVSYLLVFARIQNNFAHLIENILERNITFSGRSILWDILLKYIVQKPFLGWGMLDMPRFVNIYWAGQAHNQFLQIIFQSGLLGLVVFVIILFLFALEFDCKRHNKLTGIFVLSMLIYMVSFQTEGYVQSIFYLVLILMLNIEELENAGSRR